MDFEPEDVEVLAALAECFYGVVPLEYQTYCALTTRIAVVVLKRFGLQARLLPCQLWYMAPGVNHVIGFFGASQAPGKWDGHAACASGRWLLDTATHHVAVDLGVEVPSVVLTPRLMVPSQMVARFDVGSTQSLSWLLPPPGVDGNPPNEPAKVIESFGDRLYGVVKERLARAASKSP